MSEITKFYIGDKIQAKFKVDSEDPKLSRTVYYEGTVTDVDDENIWVGEVWSFALLRPDYEFLLLHRPSPFEPKGLGAVVEVSYDDATTGEPMRARFVFDGKGWRREGGTEGRDDWNWVLDFASSCSNRTISVVHEGV